MSTVPEVGPARGIMEQLQADFRDFRREMREEFRSLRADLAGHRAEFVQHNTEDDARHKQAMDAIGDIKEARAHEAGVAEGIERATGIPQVPGKPPMMQREAVLGMTVREVISIILAIIAALGGSTAALRSNAPPPDPAPVSATP